MEFEGVVEAVSYKNKGVKINGRWYNVSEDVIKQVQRNQKVRVVTDDYGNIIDLYVLGYEEQIDKDIKLEALRASIEVLKLSLQYGQPYDLTPATDIKNFDEQVKSIVKLLERTYKDILNIIK